MTLDLAGLLIASGFRLAARERDRKELLRIAERQVRRLFDVTERIFDFAHEATKDEEVRRGVRTEVNEYLADYQRRRDPVRMVSLAEVLEELRKAFPRAQFERVRARLEAQDLPERADMFSAEPGEKEKRQARPRRRRAAVG